jgi:hypothetical protein
LVPENELLIRIRAVTISLAPAASENVAVIVCDEPLPELGLTETDVGADVGTEEPVTVQVPIWSQLPKALTLWASR